MRPRYLVFATARLAALAALTVIAHPAAAQVSPPGAPADYALWHGIAIPDADRAELTAGAADLGKEIDELHVALAGKPDLLALLPDVQIFYNAVHYPLAYNEFYTKGDIATARRFLTEGHARAAELKAGTASWTTKTGLVVLGYVSKIDGSVQPYGLQVPTTYTEGDKRPHRLDFFLHGRDDKLTELHFIAGRERSPGEFSPPDAFVLQPYGRDCVANRFAGEVDLFEALDDAKRRYPIDPNRVIVRGFSMGGASCWQFATHDSDQFAGAAPGAGFTETANYTKAFAPGKIPPPLYQQTLWHWYNSVDYAVNLAQLPIVAYSGEIDPQRQAAINMAEAMEKEGLTLTQVIGPKTAHRYAPESKPIINAFLDRAAAKGRDTLPMSIRFTTFTLRYNHMDWLTVDGMNHHWERARVEATRTSTGDITIKTENVTALSLNFPSPTDRIHVTIDGQKVGVGERFVRGDDGKWHQRRASDLPGLHKTHGLQGPIDDAFMDRFVMVRPTGKPMNDAVGTWTQTEMAHALHFWRSVFRGEAPTVDDSALSADQIANANLVLWGDPSSNSVLKRIADKLPVRWDSDGTLHAGGKSWPAGSVPILIYPNPLNPAHYVVLNSGITFREGNLSSNSLQTPKLPDWAIIDTSTPPDAYAPGRVVDAGFFDEGWKM
jgi:predicted esterase